MAHEVTLITGDSTVPELAAAVIAEGTHVTYDRKPNRHDSTDVGTREMPDAICAKRNV